jgi:hypothetical protein
MRKKGYSSFEYFADHPAALAICRKQGCEEAFVDKKKRHGFYLSLLSADK